MGQFNWLGTYTNPSHLAFDEVAEIWRESESVARRHRAAMSEPAPLQGADLHHRLHLHRHAARDRARLHHRGRGERHARLIKGPVIFFSLLPMIVTPLVGSLVLFWMIDSQGVIGATLQRIFNDPQLSLKASPTLTWVTLFVYGVWHAAPFSFVVFYAGLQTVPAGHARIRDDRRRKPLGAHPLRRDPHLDAARRPSSP